MIKIKNLFNNRLFLIPALIFFAVIIGIFVKFSSSAPTGNIFVVAERGNLLQEVNVIGKVEPAENVDLAFEKTGKVNRINVSVGNRVFAGQFLVGLNNTDLVAQLAEAEANIKVKMAELEELRLGTRPEEIRVAEAKVRDAKQELVNKLQDAYTKSDDAVRNKVDQFFSNPRSSSPKLSFITGETALEAEVERQRNIIEPILLGWNSSLDSLLLEKNLDPFITEGKENLDIIKNFLESVALVINILTPSSNLTQTTINNYRADVSTARTDINTAINNLSKAESDLVIKETELVLKQSGTITEQINASEAQVEKAEASVDKIKAQIATTNIFSPINGVVTKQDAKVGEIVAANTVLVSIISEAQFEIKTNIPEVDITKVKINDLARTTLDAYGNDIIFKTKVIAIDPAETIIDGVATYKVTLQFTVEDERVRSGMTANLDILTASRQDVVFVPQRAVFTKNGDKFVRVLATGGEISEVEVVPGLRGSEGNIEIIEGIKEGDRVIIFLSE